MARWNSQARHLPRRLPPRAVRAPDPPTSNGPPQGDSLRRPDHPPLSAPHAATWARTKGAGGKLSRQGPPMLPGPSIEAATSAWRPTAPDPADCLKVTARAVGGRARWAVARNLLAPHLPRAPRDLGDQALQEDAETFSSRTPCPQDQEKHCDWFPETMILPHLVSELCAAEIPVETCQVPRDGTAGLRW